MRHPNRAEAGLAFAAGASLLGPVESLPIPLGVVPAALVAGYLLYLGVRYFRAWASKGELATRGIQGSGPPAALSWSSTEEAESPPPPTRVSPRGIAGLVPPAPTPVWPARGRGRTPAPVPAGTPPREARLWTPEGEMPLPGDWHPRTVSVAPPAQRLFGRNLVVAFLGVVLLLLAFHAYVFYALDRIVAVAGRLLFWPLDWPGLIQDPGLRRQLPDYIFIMYIAVMVAFVLATGLFTDPRFARTQRRDALLILGGYLLTEVTIDIFFFSVSNRFIGSSFLVIRGAIGGLFFALLIFSTLYLPPALRLGRVLPRDRSALHTFIGTALLALGISVTTLYLLFRYLGLGREVIPFAILLMAPLLAITIFGGLGRLLYERELRVRPRPSLEEFHPSVSIIIPAYNEGENVVATVRSADAAAAQYPGPVEIIVANDGSRDQTSALAKSAIRALRHARGAVVDLPHGGKSQALNGALSAARGEIVIRVDGDTRISTVRGFGEMVRHLADPEVGGVQGLILPLQQDGWVRKLRFMEVAWNHLFLRRALMGTRCAQVVDGSFCAFRRSDMLALGGWVSWNGEDTEITLRLQRMGYRVRYETGAAAFEDVPNTLPKLRSQRIRWFRGGIIAHRRHLTGLFGDAFEFGGLPIIFWFALFLRAGLRSLIWVFAALATLLLGLPTLLDVAFIALLLLVPRGFVLGYYLVRFRRWRWLPYISMWPITGTIKQYFAMESIGSLMPGGAAEFAE